MGKYEDVSIRKLVSEINEKYFLPEIQREFVWSNDKNKFEDKVYDLFDSLLRDYPIGTFLFWEVKHENLINDNITVLKFLTNSNKENETIEKEQFINKNCILVLDGQQRMTILNLALKGIFEEEYRNKKIKKYLYFNLLSNPDEEKEVNERIYEFKLFDKEENYFKQENKIWCRVNIILNKEFNSFTLANEIANKNQINNDSKEYNLIGTNLGKLNNVCSNEIISYYPIDSTKNDEEALEIFVRVNSGGVPLTYSDLLFSKIKQYWKKENEKKEKIDAREEFKDFLSKINQDLFEFDNDFILKTSLMIIDTDIRYKIKNFNKSNVELIKKDWRKIQDSINVVIDFLKSINITSKKYLRSNNAIIPLVYYVYLNSLKEIDNTSKDYDLMKKYIYSVLINGVFGGQSDSLLKDSRDVIKENKKDLFPIEEIFRNFTKKNKIIRRGEDLKEVLKDIRYGSDKNKLILSIIYGNNLPKNFQEDHMFPRVKMKKKFDKSLVDNIANIQALGLVNQAKGDKSFEDWLNEPKRSKDYMETHLIPKLENYNENNFEEFIEKRRNLIFEKIKEFFE